MWNRNRDVLYEFHLKFWNTASIGIPVRRLLTGLTAQQKGTTAQWYSNKISLIEYLFFALFIKNTVVIS